MNEMRAEEAGYERGWEQAEDYWRAKEQDRIIELLDECVCDASVEKCMTCECDQRKIKRADLIALIKGENK